MSVVISVQFSNYHQASYYIRILEKNYQMIEFFRILQRISMKLFLQGFWQNCLNFPKTEKIY